MVQEMPRAEENAGLKLPQNLKVFSNYSDNYKSR
jgi:hypothetical protein